MESNYENNVQDNHINSMNYENQDFYANTYYDNYNNGGNDNQIQTSSNGNKLLDFFKKNAVKIRFVLIVCLILSLIYFHKQILEFLKENVKNIFGLDLFRDEKRENENETIEEVDIIDEVDDYITYFDDLQGTYFVFSVNKDIFYGLIDLDYNEDNKTLAFSFKKDTYNMKLEKNKFIMEDNFLKQNNNVTTMNIKNQDYLLEKNTYIDVSDITGEYDCNNVINCVENVASITYHKKNDNITLAEGNNKYEFEFLSQNLYGKKNKFQLYKNSNYHTILVVSNDDVRVFYSPQNSDATEFSILKLILE